VIRLLRVVQVLQILQDLGYRAALVGGLAVSARARERFTKDIDFAVAVDSDADAEMLALAVQRRGFRLVAVIEQEAKGVIATLRLVDPTLDDEDPTVDLLCASSGIEREIVRAARPLILAPGIRVHVACLGHLLAMKVLSVSDSRDQDRADLRALLEVATHRDLEDAREAAALIVARGFHRGRDLSDDLERLIAELGPPAE
jgi:hypothetical protein